MSLAENNTLQFTVQQLKEIVTHLSGENHESAHLIQQMETLAAQIDRKRHSPVVTSTTTSTT